MRIGIYGGTFSPVHSGHVLAAREFIRRMKLDRLLIIPAFEPPHKEMSTPVSAELRFEMCRLAFEGIDGVEISDIEISRGGRSYTIDTVTALKEKYPDDQLFLLVGTDMILTFDLWRRYLDILSLCTLVYVRREKRRELDDKISEKVSLIEKQSGRKIRYIRMSPLEISSTELRGMIRRGEDVGKYLPESVREFISKKGLYLENNGENNV